MPTALITGIAGQDGWYLAELLLSSGYRVFGLELPGHPAPVPAGVTLLDGDLTDRDSVAAALATADPDEIYNLAGISSVALSWKQPELTFAVNAMGFVHLVEGARRQADRTGRQARIVQASSAEIFGPQSPPFSETTPLQPMTPYGLSKAFAHDSARVYRSIDVPVSSAVLFNHESPRRPDTFVTRRITKTVAGIANGSGERLTLGNLHARRDWGSAVDVVRALHLIATHDEPDDFVVATGVSHSVGDFVAAAFDHVGIRDWQAYVDVDQDLLRPNDAPEQIGDASKARQVLGWKPEITFEQMVADMVDADLK